jgi:UDP-2,4-diacetamido-2,4,6-trideoxy-beta-L-altropyranose hydrolase
LAKQFEDAEIIFACRDLSGHIMDQIPYPIMIVDSDSIDELIMIVKSKQIDMVVIDHYGIGYEEEKRLKEGSGVKIFVLDDTYERHYCDVLLNHNISADEKRYKGLVPKGCELRCGSDYTLIRDEFVKAKREKRVFVAMGGSDASEVNIKVLKVLKKFENLKVDIVTTSANANLEKLKKYVKGKPWVTLHIDTKKIAKLMKKCDFAIVTPSVTVNEVYYMQVPFIAIKTAENQKEIYEYLKENGFLVIEKFNSKELKNVIKGLV